MNGGGTFKHLLWDRVLSCAPSIQFYHWNPCHYNIPCVSQSMVCQQAWCMEGRFHPDDSYGWLRAHRSVAVDMGFHRLEV